MKFIWVVVVFLLLLVSCSKSNRNPVALFTMNPDNGRSPLKVSFDASNSSDLDGTIKDYQWNFGDGKTAEGANVEHEFTAEGEYDIELRVIDNDGAEGSISKKLLVKDNSVPLAESQQLSTKQDEAIDITLVASDKEDDVLTYTITSNPENGSLTGNAPNIRYQPNNDFVGIDSLTFKVNDGRDDSSAAIINITVTDGLEPNNDINQATNIATGEVVRSFINPDGDIDWFSFELDKETTIAITVRAKEITSDLDPFVALLDKDEEVIAKNDNRDADNTDSFLEVNIAAGNYFLSVWDSNKGDLFPQLAPLAASTTFYEITVEINPCKPDPDDADCPIGDADGDGIKNADDSDNNDPCKPNEGNTACQTIKDPDEDGLSNTQETALGTDPNKADTDGDSVKDGDEVGNDPANPIDSDGDGKIDALESNKADADNDGSSDEADAHNNDPCKPNEEIGICDRDSDNLTNEQEAVLKTDSTKTDTDGDGEKDGDEVGDNLADPIDTDGDGKIDALESSQVDADNDGSNDEVDSADGNPCVPDSTVQACITSLTTISPKESDCADKAVGENCTVTISLKNNDYTVKGFGFKITNTPNNFDLTSINTVGDLPKDCLVAAVPQDNAVVGICQAGKEFSGDGTLVNLTFTRTSEGNTTFKTSSAKITIDTGEAIDVQGEEL